MSTYTINPEVDLKDTRGKVRGHATAMLRAAVSGPERRTLLLPGLSAPQATNSKTKRQA